VYRLLDFLDRILEEIGGLFYGPSPRSGTGRWPGAGLTVLCIILMALAAGLAWFDQRWGEAFCLMSLGLGAFVAAVFCNHMR
jgi:hypothetical protein